MPLEKQGFFFLPRTVGFQTAFQEFWIFSFFTVIKPAVISIHALHFLFVLVFLACSGRAASIALKNVSNFSVMNYFVFGYVLSMRVFLS